MSADEKQQTDSKRPWETPNVKAAGTLQETIRGGGGKLSPKLADTGDDRKPKGQG
jgi:hypothetical protein